MSKRGLTLFELITVVFIIFILLGVFAFAMRDTIRIAREEALRSELMNLRMSLEHFRIINNRLPESLRELSRNDLTGEKFDSIIVTQKFLNLARQDKEGFLLDPFMHRYGYDSEKGIISSQTEGFRTW